MNAATRRSAGVILVVAAVVALGIWGASGCSASS